MQKTKPRESGDANLLLAVCLLTAFAGVSAFASAYIAGYVLDQLQSTDALVMIVTDAGLKSDFIPVNLKTELLDGVIQVDAEPAREYARRCAAEEGILVGISSGATLAAIAQKLPDLPAGATVLGFNYDTGERYLSIEGFLPA